MLILLLKCYSLEIAFDEVRFVLVHKLCKIYEFLEQWKVCAKHTAPVNFNLAFF
jgi:hypothetical protein